MPLTAAAAAAGVVIYETLYLIAALRIYESSCLLKFADGGIYNKLNFVVFDGVDDIRSSFVHFEYSFGFNAVVCEEFQGVFGGLDFKAEFFKLLCGLAKFLSYPCPRR